MRVTAYKNNTRYRTFIEIGDESDFLDWLKTNNKNYVTINYHTEVLGVEASYHLRNSLVFWGSSFGVQIPVLYKPFEEVELILEKYKNDKCSN